VSDAGRALVGRALVVHGLTSGPGAMWRVREHLEERGWDVATPALLGHGARGPAPSYRLEAYAAELPAGPWDLVIGHSLGGAAVLVRATDEPGWARRLILLDPAWWIPPEHRAQLRADQIAALTPAADEFDGWDPRDADAKRAAIAGIDAETPARTVDENQDWDLRPRAAALDQPTLFLGADPDVFALLRPEDAVAAVAASGRRATYAIVEGAGHSVHRERPATTLAAIDGWLARVG
jgi:pimeloyl-ACP methyl ester carboxylesterase